MQTEEKKTTTVKDGIIDEKTWNKQDIKVLFLLKEAYDRDGRDISWDIPKYIKGEPCILDENNNYTCNLCNAAQKQKCKSGKIAGGTYNRVAEAVMAITENVEYDNYLRCKEKNLSYVSRRKELLCRSAIINIKQTNGKSTSSDKELRDLACNDSENIYNRIAETAPDVIICGGTGEYFDEIFREHHAEINKYTVIKTKHPNARCKAVDKYNEIRNEYKKTK